ncbi:MAG: hypothetical protein MJZ71_05475 [Bacteroidales bacterium]|nr:hypothetical protein [Bacteroidales bacterium]
MDNIFDIRFTFEKICREKVITKFSNKQGGDYNVFSYHWQCFVWAAIIGFLRGERRELKSPYADKAFSLSTMSNNGGEKDAQALICLAIAKAGTLEIMKNPEDAIKLINEYANGGFYHIMKLIDNGETSYNDLEQVKQEIFSREYKGFTIGDETLPANSFLESDEENNDNLNDILDFSVENTSNNCFIKNRNGERVFVDTGALKIIDGTPYRFNWKQECLTVKGVMRYGNNWIKGSTLFVAYNDSNLYSVLNRENCVEEVEDLRVEANQLQNRIKVNGIWFDYGGNVIENNDELCSDDNQSILKQNDAYLSDTYIVQQGNVKMKKRRWSVSERKDLIDLYSKGMSVESLAKFFQRENEEILEILKKTGINV